jgi:hypothetical protein
MRSSNPVSKKKPGFSLVGKDQVELQLVTGRTGTTDKYN